MFENHDRLLQPIALDLMPMMEIIHHERLIDLLTRLKSECFELIKIEEKQRGFDVIDRETLDVFFNEYLKLLSSKIA